MATVQISVS